MRLRQIIGFGIWLVMSVSLCGCTHNNGDIGAWFGTWKLDSITINGTLDAEYAENVLWKFQANLVDMVRVIGQHEQYEMYGTWSEPSAGVLRLSYIYSDDNDGVGSMKYSPLPETHLPTGVSDLKVLKLKGKHMQLEYIATDGIVYGYMFTKW